MGKNRISIRIKNHELQDDLEYLLASTGYFDFVRDVDEDVLIVDSETEYLLEKTFSEFVGELLEKTGTDVKRRETFLENTSKTIALGSTFDGDWTKMISIHLGHFLFKKGYSAAYINLSPLNKSIDETCNNEKGFLRWLMDSGRGIKGEMEKYFFYDGEMHFMGAPLFNPNAGDVKFDDIRFLQEVISEKKVDVLIIDIGSNLDMEREKILLSSDCPILGMEGEKNDEILLHKYFEGALGILANKQNYEKNTLDILEHVEELMRGRCDEAAL